MLKQLNELNELNEEENIENEFFKENFFDTNQNTCKNEAFFSLESFKSPTQDPFCGSTPVQIETHSFQELTPNEIPVKSVWKNLRPKFRKNPTERKSIWDFKYLYHTPEIANKFVLPTSQPSITENRVDHEAATPKSPIDNFKESTSKKEFLDVFLETKQDYSTPKNVPSYSVTEILQPSDFNQTVTRHSCDTLNEIFKKYESENSINDSPKKNSIKDLNTTCFIASQFGDIIEERTDENDQKSDDSSNPKGFFDPCEILDEWLRSGSVEDNFCEQSKKSPRSALLSKSSRLIRKNYGNSNCFL